MEMKFQEKRSSSLFMLIFALLLVGFGATGSLYYINYEQQYRRAIESQLTSITDLKVNALANWRTERLGDANTLYHNEAFSALVVSYLNGSTESQAALKEWLQQYLEGSQYDQVRLLDGQGKTRLVIPDGAVQVSTAVTKRLSEVWQTGKMTLVDFYRSEADQQVYLTLLVPIYKDQAGQHPLELLHYVLIPPFTFILLLKAGQPQAILLKPSSFGEMVTPPYI